MKHTYFNYCFLLLLISCCETSNHTKEIKKDNILKKCKIEKLGIVNCYLDKDYRNYLFFNWKEFNNDFRNFKLLIVDTVKPEADFFFISQKYVKRISNCKDLFSIRYLLRCNSGKAYIFRWTEKSKRQTQNTPDEYMQASDYELLKYLYEKKRDRISWDEVKKLFFTKQKLIGFNNKIDSLEFIVQNRDYITYFSISPQSNTVFGQRLPLDTIINCQILSKTF